MPISYRIEVDRDLVLTTASGTLTDDDVLELKARLVRDPGFKSGMKELTDIRNIDRLDVTSAGVRAMVEQDRRDRTEIAAHRLALVVSANVAYGWRACIRC